MAIFTPAVLTLSSAPLTIDNSDRGTAIPGAFFYATLPGAIPLLTLALENLLLFGMLNDFFFFFGIFNTLL